LQKGLRANGFSTLVAEIGPLAAEMARDADFDLVILDLGLPEMDGQCVLRTVRRRGERLPVIILTARGGLDDTVTGLESGAEDYITKPFKFDELLARIRVAFATARTPSPRCCARPTSCWTCARRATVGDRCVELTAREFTLAETLMRHAGHVLSREQLLSHGWGYNFDPARTSSMSTSATSAAHSATT
jgi:DNA-binding response OmpR family regulator